MSPPQVDALRRNEPVFSDAIERCAEIAKEVAGLNIFDPAPASNDGAGAPTPHARAALVALQSALAALWESWGIRPDCVLGVGIGDFAAAASAGVLTVEDAMRMAIVHARFGGATPDTGLAGAALRGDGADRGGVSRSRHLLLEEFAASLTRFSHREPTRTFVTASADLRIPERAEEWPGFWRERLRRPLDLPAALRRLRETGCDIFLEIGGNAALGGVIGRNPDELWLASLQSDERSERGLTDSLAQLYAAGRRVDLQAFHGGRRGPWDFTPLYPFERQRYWLDDHLNMPDELVSEFEAAK
jgi:acyl transferase domain-containing protein